jgi:hypothetical protein
LFEWRWETVATAPAARTPDRHPAGVGPRAGYGRRAEDPGRPASRPQTVAVTVRPDTYQVAVEPGSTVTAPRTASRDIRRHKAPSYG